MVEESLCQQLSNGWIITGLILIFVVMLLGTVGNALVCSVLFRLKTSEASFSSIFVISVAASDLMTCLTVLPFDVIYWVHFPVWILSPVVCKIWNSLFFIFIGCSALSLTEVAIDMYIAVSRPLHYSIYVTRFRAKVVLVITWIWCFMVGLLIYLYQEEPPVGEYLFDLTPPGYGSYLLLHMAIPCVLVSVVYFKLFRIARSHASRLKIFPSSLPTSDSTAKVSETTAPSDPSVPSTKTASNRDKKLKIKEELKLAKTFGLVATMFFVCWAPFFAVQLFYVFHLEELVDACSLEIADTVVCWFAYIQCCINPILYAFRHRSFRRSMSRVFMRCHFCNKVLKDNGNGTTVGIRNTGFG